MSFQSFRTYPYPSGERSYTLSKVRRYVTLSYLIKSFSDANRGKYCYHDIVYLTICIAESNHITVVQKTQGQARK